VSNPNDRNKTCFEYLNFGHLNLFRASYFVLRICSLPYASLNGIPSRLRRTFASSSVAAVVTIIMSIP